MQRNHPAIPFERYADDAICHCRSEEQARTLRASLEKRFAECGLTLHPEKTKIVYCKDDDRRGDYPTRSSTSSAIRFGRGCRADGMGSSASRSVRRSATKRSSRSGRPSATGHFTSAVTSRSTIWRGCSTPHIRGWINYYGRFYKSALYPALRHIDRILARWAYRKFKSLRRHKRRTHHWLLNIAQRQPDLFAHWSLALWTRPNNGSRMRRESHVRFCESAAVKSRRATHPYCRLPT